MRNSLSQGDYAKASAEAILVKQHNTEKRFLSGEDYGLDLLNQSEEWARKNYHGLDGTIAPSFTPDLSDLDEEGIRWDVQHNIRKGMFSILCETMIGVMSFEERKRFMEIVCDEAKGKILVSVTTGIDDVEQDIALLQHFEKVGGTHTLFGYPVTSLQRTKKIFIR